MILLSSMHHFIHASGDVSESPNRRTFFSIVLEFFFPGSMGTSIFHNCPHHRICVLIEIVICVFADEFSDLLCLPCFPAIAGYSELPGVISLCPTRKVTVYVFVSIFLKVVGK